MDVGIRELESRLSEFVERAAEGHIIRVTDRGRPKAILGPVPGRGAFERGRAEGRISPGNGDAPVLARRRHSARRSIDEVLEEDRGR